MKRTIHISLLITMVSLAACSRAPVRKSPAVTGYTQSEAAESKPATDAANPNAMLTCSISDGKAYNGFGGVNLVTGRVTEVPKEADRFRVKPYTALSGEFTRIMGSIPASLTANAATFAAAPDRWYVEAQASAVTLFTVFRVSYESALAVTAADSKYAAAPTEESATANCTAFARQAWNRLPTPVEVAACKHVALVETATETDVKARWAYALASVLTATGFVAY